MGLIIRLAGLSRKPARIPRSQHSFIFQSCLFRSGAFSTHPAPKGARRCTCTRARQVHAFSAQGQAGVLGEYNTA